MKRFAEYSAEDIAEKRRLLTPIATTKSENSAANNFRAYLKEKCFDTNFENFSKEELDKKLSKFYVEARTKDGELYKKTSLDAFRYGLNRYLKKTSTSTFDLLKDPAFADSNDCFKVALKEIKSAGKAEIDHKPPLSESDRQKLYKSIFFNPDTPQGLYNKVQYDVRYYFARRGSENMNTLTKDSFMLKRDPDTGKRFVVSKDELTKNHGLDDTDADGGLMVETHTDDCPVNSFLKYLSKLDPEQDRLWCYPKDSFRHEEELWYTKKPVGVNTLQQFLPKLSQQCGLSQIYTNHSIRSTSATLLHQDKFDPTAVKSITGHKSLSSLAVYQRTSSKQKIEMAHALHRKIAGGGHSVPSASASSSHGASSIPTPRGDSMPASMSISELGDLNFVFDDINIPEDIAPGPASFPQGLFNNCNIGSISIVYKYGP